MLANTGSVNRLIFGDSSTAGHANIDGGVILFQGNSTAGDASFSWNGYVDFSGTTGPAGDHKVSVGSINNTNLYLGSAQLTIGETNADSLLNFVHDGRGPITDTPDQTGGSLVKVGTGSLTLLGDGEESRAYSGGTTLADGTLVVASVGAAGTGAITFMDGQQLLEIRADAIGDSGGVFGNVLQNFGPEDTLHLAGFAYNAGASATAANGTFTVTSGGISESFALSTSHTNLQFSVVSDGTDGLRVTYTSADSSGDSDHRTVTQTEAGWLIVTESGNRTVSEVFDQNWSVTAATVVTQDGHRTTTEIYGSQWQFNGATVVTHDETRTTTEVFDQNWSVTAATVISQDGDRTTTDSFGSQWQFIGSTVVTHDDGRTIAEVNSGSGNDRIDVGSADHTLVSGAGGGDMLFDVAATGVIHSSGDWHI